MTHRTKTWIFLEWFLQLLEAKREGRPVTEFKVYYPFSTKVPHFLDD